MSEEKVINGVLHYRSSVNDLYVKYTDKELTENVGELKEVIEEQKFTLQQSRDIIKRLRTENEKLKRFLKHPNLTKEQKEANLAYNLKAIQGDE